MLLRFSERLIAWFIATLILAGLLFSKCAFAAHEIGNGGNAVDCEGKAELLDLFEAKTLRKARIVDYPSTQSARAKVDSQAELAEAIQLALGRVAILQSFDPKSAGLYSIFLKALEQQTEFVESIDLVAIDDSKHLVVPAACRVKQLAVFRKSVSAGEKRLLIHHSLWRRLSKVDRVGLVLHESIYRHLAGLGQKDSVHTRFLVGFLLEVAFSQQSSARYWQEIRRMKLPIYDPAQ